MIAVHGAAGRVKRRSVRIARLATTYWRLVDPALAVLRLAIGGGILTHGYPKVFGGGAARIAERLARDGWPWPDLFGWAAALSELVGGGLLVLGLATAVGAGLVGITMIVAVLVIHAGDPFATRELAVLYLAGCVAIGLAGPGRFSLDDWLARPTGAKPPAAR